MSKIIIYHFLHLENKLELLWTIFPAAFFRIGILKRLDNDNSILSMSINNSLISMITMITQSLGFVSTFPTQELSHGLLNCRWIIN